MAATPVVAKQTLAEEGCEKIRAVHRALRRSLQGIVDTAPQVVPKQQKDFILYCETFCASLHHHHITEDSIIFPALATVCGVLEQVNRLESEHDLIDPLVLALTNAARARHYDGKSVAQAAAALQAHLLPHLEYEESIFTVEVMARAGDQRLKEMFERIDSNAQLSDLFTKLPFFVSNMTKEEAELVVFSGAPWVMGKVLYPLLFSRVHNKVWRKFAANPSGPAAAPTAAARRSSAGTRSLHRQETIAIRQPATAVQTTPLTPPLAKQTSQAGLLAVQLSSSAQATVA